MDQTIFDPIDAYCERLGPGLWAEPLNALTNLAFLSRPLICLRRLGHRPPLGLALVGVLAAIGVGSGLFHTFANGLTALLDVLAIAVFVFLYVFAVNRHVLGWSRGWAWASMLALAPYLALATTAFRRGARLRGLRPLLVGLRPDRGLRRVLWSRRPGLRPRPPDRRGDPGGVDHARSLDLALCGHCPSAPISSGTSSTRSCWAG
jgi:hypothetical protein